MTRGVHLEPQTRMKLVRVYYTNGNKMKYHHQDIFPEAKLNPSQN